LKYLRDEAVGKLASLSEAKSNLDVDIVVARTVVERAKADLGTAVGSYNELIDDCINSFKNNEKLAFIARYKNISKDDTGFQSQSTTTDN